MLISLLLTPFLFDYACQSNEWKEMIDSFTALTIGEPVIKQSFLSKALNFLGCPHRKQRTSWSVQSIFNVADALASTDISVEEEDQITSWSSFTLARSWRNLLKGQKDILAMTLEQFFFFAFTNSAFRQFKVDGKIYKALEATRKQKDQWQMLDLTVDEVERGKHSQTCALAALASILPKDRMDRLRLLRVGFVYHLLYDCDMVFATRIIMDDEHARLKNELPSLMKRLRAGPDPRFAIITPEYCNYLLKGCYYLSTNRKHVLKYFWNTGILVRNFNALARRLGLRGTVSSYAIAKLSEYFGVKWNFLLFIACFYLFPEVTIDSSILRTSIRRMLLAMLSVGMIVVPLDKLMDYQVSDFQKIALCGNLYNIFFSLGPTLEKIALQLRDLKSYNPSLNVENPYYDVDLWRCLGLNDGKLCMRKLLAYVTKLAAESTKPPLPVNDTHPEVHNITELENMDAKMIGAIAPHAFAQINCKRFLDLVPWQLVLVTRAQMEAAPHLVDCISAHQLFHLGQLHSLSNMNPLKLFKKIVAQLPPSHQHIVRLRTLKKTYVQQDADGKIVCPVCLCQTEKMMRLGCGHVISDNCLSDIRRREKKCPTCLEPITSSKERNPTKLANDVSDKT